jgi:hypothetical protein
MCCVDLLRGEVSHEGVQEKLGVSAKKQTLPDNSLCMQPVDANRSCHDAIVPETKIPRNNAHIYTPDHHSMNDPGKML